MSETNPVAYIDQGALAELEKHPGASATVWSGKATHRFAQAAEPLYPASALTYLMEENAALAAHACVFLDGSGLTGDEHGNSICLMQRRAEAAEARAQAAEQRVKEAVRLLILTRPEGEGWTVIPGSNADDIERFIKEAGE